MVGSDYHVILSETQRLLDDADSYARAAKCESPYGDGFAANKIVKILMEKMHDSAVMPAEAGIQEVTQ